RLPRTKRLSAWGRPLARRNERLARTTTDDYMPCHVWEGHPEQRTAALCHRRWHERARQPRAQLSAAVERRAEPGFAGHSPQSQDGAGVARPAALGTHSVLVH